VNYASYPAGVITEVKGSTVCLDPKGGYMVTIWRYSGPLNEHTENPGGHPNNSSERHQLFHKHLFEVALKFSSYLLLRDC